MRAIEHIVAGYSTLKDRVALEKIRDHRRRLLDGYRMRDGSVLKFDGIRDDIRDEIAVVEAALSQMHGEPVGRPTSAT
jgi:hypothetical protein